MAKDKGGSPPCGIYMRIDDVSNMLDTIGYVRQFAFAVNRASGYEKNMSVVELVCSDDNVEKMSDLIPIIKHQGLIVIVRNADNIEDADGYLVHDLETLEVKRLSCGDDLIIGLDCMDSELPNGKTECSADYFILPAQPQAIGEMKKVFGSTLCVARGAGITPNNCDVLMIAGADLIDFSDYILSHEKGVMQATVNVMHALDLAHQSSHVIN